MMEELESRVLKTILKYGLIKLKESVIVGFSGGPDSVFLLEVLLKLKNEIKFNLAAAHFDHSLREDSYLDLEFAKNFSAKKNVPFFSKKENVLEYKKLLRISLEEAARKRRLKFLFDLKEKLKADKIALGHTFDDNIETILLKILKGTGLKGLRGILPLSLKCVIHPLLDVKKQEILEYLNLHNISYRIDSSNLEVEFERNKLRNKIIPIVKEYFPAFDESILRVSKIAQLEEEFFENILINLEKTLLLEGKLPYKFPLRIDKNKLLTINDLLKRRFFLNIFEKIDIRADFDLIERLINFLNENKTGKILNLKQDIVLRTGYKYFYIEKMRIAEVYEEKILEIDSETDFACFKFKAEIFKKDELARLKGERFYITPKTSREAFFDFDKIEIPLTLRYFKKGDIVEPFSSKSFKKKLQDIFVDEHIDKTLRGKIPLLFSSSKLMWIPEVIRSRYAIITDETKNVLWVRLFL